MGSKIYKFEASLIEDKFFSAISLASEDVQDADTELVDIEMLRVGKFNHKVYGEIDVTDDMLDSLVNNFHSNVIGRDVSFDWNHEAKQASAWLRDVRVEDGVLIGSVDFTDKGKSSVESKEYGYFSIEYADNYENPETGDEFGPTILGGALTNRPFITNLQKISFEEEGTDFSLYKMEESMNKKKATKTPIKRSPVGDGGKTFEEVKKEKEELEAKLEEMSQKNKELEESAESQNTVLSEVQKRLKKLEDSNESLKTEANQAKDKARKIEIEKKCEDLLNKKHHPSVVAVAKEIMLSDSLGSETIKFTEEVKEGDEVVEKEVKCSLTDAVVKLLEAIPTTLRANYGEETTSLSSLELDSSESENLEDNAIKKVLGRRKLVSIESARSAK